MRVQRLQINHDRNKEPKKRKWFNQISLRKMRNIIKKHRVVPKERKKKNVMQREKTWVQRSQTNHGKNIPRRNSAFIEKRKWKWDSKIQHQTENLNSKGPISNKFKFEYWGKNKPKPQETERLETKWKWGSKCELTSQRTNTTVAYARVSLSRLKSPKENGLVLHLRKTADTSEAPDLLIIKLNRIDNHKSWKGIQNTRDELIRELNAKDDQKHQMAPKNKKLKEDASSEITDKSRQEQKT